nr:MAG TPA: hypothetical protein [Caudoviricetes sp.]DAV87292.1 MAG TPA: hypothetical protein [Caudoviricetes sp.]
MLLSVVPSVKKKPAYFSGQITIRNQLKLHKF